MRLPFASVGEGEAVVGEQSVGDIIGGRQGGLGDVWRCLPARVRWIRRPSVSLGITEGLPRGAVFLAIDDPGRLADDPIDEYHLLAYAEAYAMSKGI